MYRAITVSGKIAVGTTTLAKHLQETLGWKHINMGEIQRQYDRKHNIHEHKQGAMSRPAEHEREIEAMTLNILKKDKNIIYEAWLSGFIAKDIPGIFKILVICSDDAIRIDRVVNRENVTIDEAKIRLKDREEANTMQWQKLYGNYDFWDPKYYDFVVDTYSSGPMESVGLVLDALAITGRKKK